MAQKKWESRFRELVFYEWNALSIDQLIDKLGDLRERYGGNAVFEIDQDYSYGDHYVTIYVKYKYYYTEGELAARKAVSEKRSAAAKKAAIVRAAKKENEELALLEKLKSKYEEK